MGYPTPPPPPLSHAEELNYVEPSTEDIQKVSIAEESLISDT